MAPSLPVPRPRRSVVPAVAGVADLAERAAVTAGLAAPEVLTLRPG